MNFRLATHSSVTLDLLVLSLGLNFLVNKIEILGSTLQKEWLQELRQLQERPREGQWLPRVTRQESGKDAGVPVSQPQTLPPPPPASSLSRVGVQS